MFKNLTLLLSFLIFGNSVFITTSAYADCVCTCIGNGSDRLKVGNVANYKTCQQSCTIKGYNNMHCH
jgi:hypothetical protein